MDYQIVTDSASDLPEEIRGKYGIHVIPTPVVIGGETLLDGETITPDRFYSLMDEGEQEIKTFHINPDMFEHAFEGYARDGVEVVYLCFSTGIAATFNAANIAKEALLERYPDFRLTIVDSKCASAGFGLMVYKLLQLREQGAESREIAEAADFYSRHIRHIFTVQTLQHLIRGGRLGKTKGQIAESLSVKPVMTVDEKGSLASYKLVRGRKASLKALANFMQKHAVDLKEQSVFVGHGGDLESLATLRALMEEAGPPREIIETQVGCAIGAHTGRGVAVIAFLDAVDEPFQRYMGRVNA